MIATLAGGVPVELKSRAARGKGKVFMHRARAFPNWSPLCNSPKSAPGHAYADPRAFAPLIHRPTGRRPTHEAGQRYGNNIRG